MVLPIAQHCPYRHDRGYSHEGKHLMGDGSETTPTHKDGTDGINEIVHRIDIGGGIRP